MSQRKTNISNDVSITPNGKKLIQARLPFTTLTTSPKIVIGSPMTADSRKRKLSPPEDGNRSTKLSKTSGITKENIEKSGEVTVQEMVDLVETTNGSHTDVVMKDNETVNLPKTTKKSKKSLDEKVISPRRSSRATDFDVSTKVLIKIPSSKKKKANERQSKKNVVLKIDEDEDGDVIPIDSEENSLISVDGKEKCETDIIDLDLDDDSSFTAENKNSSSKKDAHQQAENSMTNEQGKDAFNIRTVEPNNSSVDKEKSHETVVEAKQTSCIEHETIKVDPSDVTTIDKEENVVPVSEKADVIVEKVENSLTSVKSCVQHHIENSDQSVATAIIKEEIDLQNRVELVIAGDNNFEDPLIRKAAKLSTGIKGNKVVKVLKSAIPPTVVSFHTNSEAETFLPTENQNQQGDVICIDNENEISSDDNEVEATKDTDFDESKVSTPTSSTVKRPIRKSIESSAPASKMADNKSLTPKQFQRQLQAEEKRLAKEKAKEERDRKLQEAKEERERKLQEAKEERERKLQEEKELRQRERDEKEEQKRKEREEKEEQKRKEREDKEEQKRKEREDKEEQKRKEKEEREKKKQAEIDAKNEEKRMKEEEKLAKEEAEMKKKRKEAEAFTKFFAKKSNKSSETDKMEVDDVEIKLNFMPFRIKDDMRLAPIVRRKLSPKSKSQFDNMVLSSPNKSSENELYIQSLRNGNHLSQTQGKTWLNGDANDDLIIIDDLEGAIAIEETSSIQKYRAKFFKFEENRRPPYYGTWQKKSSVISPRRPFKEDSKYFDYNVDSDDEWEEEEAGESLHGSDDEKESDDDYEIDNKFLVPHGHLSDEELENNDEIDDDNSPDTQKAKLKIMQKEFSDEMQKKTEKIKPRLVGLIWQNKDGSQPHGCPNVIWEMLLMRSMIFNGPSIVIPSTLDGTQKSDPSDETSDAKRKSAVKKRVEITEEGVTDLIRLIHGNTNNNEFLSKEFRAFTAAKNKDNDKFQELFLKSIRLKIKELAEWKPCPEEGPLLNKYCWYVAPEIRQKYNLEDLSMTNDWNYTLTPKTKAKTDVKKVKENDKGKSLPEGNDESPSSAKTPKSKLGNIAKFAKALSDDEKKKNFADISLPKRKPESEPSPKSAKKRVKLLVSGPRGQDIPTQTKNPLISQYLSSVNSNKKSTDNDETICID